MLYVQGGGEWDPRPILKGGPNAPSIEESSTIKNRRDGRVTYITTDSRIYFVRDGREITVIRRGA